MMRPALPVAGAIVSLCSLVAAQWDATQTPYPAVRRVNTSFTYQSAADGDVVVADPYNWLETPPGQSDEVQGFIDTQSNFTQQYIDQCTDLDDIRSMLYTVYNYSRFTAPMEVGTHDELVYYYGSNTGLDAQLTWYSCTREELLAAEAEQNNFAHRPGRKWFDENLLSANGTLSVDNYYFSQSGKYVAYSISDSGADVQTTYFRETSKPFVNASADEEEARKGGPDRLPDVLENIEYGSASWTFDDKGIFYQAFPKDSTTANSSSSNAGLAGAELYYHVLGTNQTDDIVVLPKDDALPSNAWTTTVSDDGRFLIVDSDIGGSQASRTYIASLEQPISSNMKWQSIAPNFTYVLNYVANDGYDFYWHTNKNASNWKVVRSTIDPTQAKSVSQVNTLTDEATFIDIVPEDKNATLKVPSVVDNDKLLAYYVIDVKHQLFQFELKTGAKLRRLIPDFVGSIVSLACRRNSTDVFVPTTSFTTPAIVYRLTWDDHGALYDALPTTTVSRRSMINGFDLTAFVTQQVFVPSGNVSVPVYLVYRNDTKLDGTASAYVYYYGGNAFPLMPMFNAGLLTYLATYGAVLVWVNCRGGGEYGERWHLDGNLLHKKNTFYDIMAAIEHVVDQKIVAKDKVVIRGASSGGLSTLAVTNMAPEGLISVAIAEAAESDMLRYQLFGTATFWVKEYGNSSDPVFFDYLRSYSPLHNVNATKTYPTVMLMTGDHDDRMAILHSLKMTAQLQYALPTNPNPLLLRVTSNSGHEGGSLLTDLEESSIRICVCTKALGLKRLPSVGSS